MNAIGFQQDHRGWWYFTVLLSDTANPTWPVRPGPTDTDPIGMGRSVVAASPPAGLLMPAARKGILRAVLAFQPAAAGGTGVKLRQGDGTTPYFDDAVIAISSATNPLCGFSGPLAIPLHNGLSAISPVSLAGRVLIAYEPIDF